MSDVSSSDGEPSTINLVRSSHPWTEADSAAGFVLRYLAPMRRQLTAILGSTDLRKAVHAEVMQALPCFEKEAAPKAA